MCCPCQDKAGGVAPTKKGISLSQAEWSALQGVIEATNKALADSDEAFAAELPNSIRVTTSVFRYGMAPSCTCLSCPVCQPLEVKQQQKPCGLPAG